MSGSCEERNFKQHVLIANSEFWEISRKRIFHLLKKYNCSEVIVRGLAEIEGSLSESGLDKTI
jgi:hypothetical protein